MKPDEKKSLCDAEKNPCISSFETTDDHAGSHLSFSVFGDSSCGEPLCPQHLILDFTPIEELDNDFVQRKCCAFWDFLNSRTDLYGLMVRPEKDMANSARLTPSETSKVEESLEESEPLKEATAVSMLEFVEGKGLIDRTFEAKLPQSGCSLGSREYREQEVSSKFKPPPLSKEVCECAAVCKSCKSRTMPIALLPESTPAVQQMCSKMEEWDADHPKCRPICKSRRREWRGKIQNTSAELVLERKPRPECFRRCPTKVYPNSPCPLFGRTHRVIIKEKNVVQTPNVVRICQAPVDVTVDTPYLRYAEMAKKLGAWNTVKRQCAFCTCGACCPCVACAYEPRDAERSTRRRADMREFDARVKQDCVLMRIMYD